MRSLAWFKGEMCQTFHDSNEEIFNFLNAINIAWTADTLQELQGCLVVLLQPICYAFILARCLQQK
jgi:hypothetical protein